MKRTIIALATLIVASLTVDSIFHSAASKSISTLPDLPSSSVLAYSSSPKLNTHLPLATIGEKPYLVAQASSLIGYWGSGPGGAGEHQIDFFSDGSCKIVRKTVGTGVHSYNLYGLTAVIGKFTVNGSRIRFYPKTRQVTNFPDATKQTYNYQNNAYISFSASLQNSGQTLVLTDAKGNAITYSRISENFAL